MEQIYRHDQPPSLETIKAIADQLPAMIAFYNLRSGQFLYVNEYVRDLLGYEPDDFLNGGALFAMSLIHPDDAMEVMGSNQVAVEATDKGELPPGLVVTFAYRMKHKDGRWVRVRTDGRALDTTDDGKVNNVLNVSFAVSEDE